MAISVEPADRQASSSGKDARNCILLPSDILANVVQETDGHPILVRELPQRDVPKSWFVSAAPMPSAGVALNDTDVVFCRCDQHFAKARPCASAHARAATPFMPRASAVHKYIVRKHMESRHADLHIVA
jgi:hypothetical protein